MPVKIPEVSLAPPVRAAVIIGIAAETLPAVLPVMVGVMADPLGFGSAGAGFIASANMTGIGAGSVVCAAIARLASWKWLVVAGAVVLLLGNGLTMVRSGFYDVMLVRFMAGFGEGVVAGICFAAMGQDPQPARPLAFYCAGQGLVGALGMAILPGVVSTGGWRWLFVMVAVAALPAFFLARSVATLQFASVTERADRKMPVRPTAWLVAAGILLYFIGMAAVWSFLEQMGLAKGIDTAHLAFALSASSFANMLGSLIVGFVQHRLSTAAGLLIGLSAAVAGMAGLLGWNGWQAYAAASILFFSAWGFYFPFQFRLLAKVDPSGVVPALIPLVVGAGLAIGPGVGGVLLASGGPTSLCTFGLVAVCVSGASSLALNRRSRQS